MVSHSPSHQRGELQSKPGALPGPSGKCLRHLNQVQLAGRWNISPRTLERWRWIGEGPAYLKIGGRVVYRLEDVERYEAEHLRGETTDTAAMGARGSADR